MANKGFLDEMRIAGVPVSVWENGPNYTYAKHSHDYKKILCCLRGSITFQTDNGDIHLEEGDRTILDAGVEHSAVVGPFGVRCAEGHAPAP
ncbi:MAG TPA: AraC family ligand binding domain-containing protein [Acidimicrobiales bacterium]|nr:AraC family ligand binding domain-containing protein [Acidimicrobiales bacterium]